MDFPLDFCISTKKSALDDSWENILCATQFHTMFVARCAAVPGGMFTRWLFARCAAGPA